MVDNKKILAIIPARGGSKGVVRKNIRLLQGKPLIEWTIKQAHQSRYIDRIIVSTDNDEIANTAKQCGADVPFIRPAELATDQARSTDVVLHAIDFLVRDGQIYDVLIALQVTTPLRSSEDIDRAIELLCQQGCRAVVSVYQCNYPPCWSNTLPEDGCMKDFIKPEYVKNRQELPVFYRLNGCVFVSFVEYFRKQRGFFGNKTFAYIMPMERSLDIDTEQDFKLAEVLCKRNL